MRVSITGTVDPSTASGNRTSGSLIPPLKRRVKAPTRTAARAVYVPWVF